MTTSAAQRRRYNRPRAGLRCLAPVRGWIQSIDRGTRMATIVPDRPETNLHGQPILVVVPRRHVQVDLLQHLVIRCTSCGDWRHKRRVCPSCRAPIAERRPR